MPRVPPVEDNMGVFMGYWNADAATHKVFKHGYYYTLDKAYKCVRIPH
jgi:long-subunit acyl-CoA synthetase (AMP-forming)